MFYIETPQYKRIGTGGESVKYSVMNSLHGIYILIRINPPFLYFTQRCPNEKIRNGGLIRIIIYRVCYPSHYI